MECVGGGSIGQFEDGLVAEEFVKRVEDRLLHAAPFEDDGIGVGEDCPFFAAKGVRNLPCRDRFNLLLGEAGSASAF